MRPCTPKYASTVWIDSLLFRSDTMLTVYVVIVVGSVKILRKTFKPIAVQVWNAVFHYPKPWRPNLKL